MRAGAPLAPSADQVGKPLPVRTFRDGAVAGLPCAAASAVLAVSFGVVASDVGMPVLATVLMSAVDFSGSAQFAAVGILAGGGVLPAVSAAALMTSRFVPMGFALGSSLHGGRVRRAVEGQLLADPSWAMAARGDGRFDRSYLFGHTVVQYLAWVAGTLGVVVRSLDAAALGLDAVSPAFFRAILIGKLRDRRLAGVATAGAVIALALVPVAPPGVPVLVAASAALVGLRRRQS